MTGIPVEKITSPKRKAKNVPKSDALTPKQERFVEEYLIDLNATQAAIRAGYAPGSAEVQGSRLLTYAKVIEAISANKEKRAERTNITADRVLNGISRLIDRCEQAEPVLDKEGLPTGEYTFKANEALRGYDLLGRHLGLWNDKLKLQGDSDNPLTVLMQQIGGSKFPVKAE